MRHQSFSFLGIIMLLFVVSCRDKRLYYIDHTKFGRFNYSVPCNPELVDKINTNWLEHGKYNCHHYNQFVQDFPQNYKYCIQGLDVTIIVKLFGQPNSKTECNIEYIIAERCHSKMQNFGKLVFNFDKNNKITNVTFGLFVITE